MKKRKRITVKVSFELPEGATVRAAQAYIADAVGSWHGSLKPTGHEDGDGDPMFDLDPDTIKVVASR